MEIPLCCWWVGRTTVGNNVIKPNNWDLRRGGSCCGSVLGKVLCPIAQGEVRVRYHSIVTYNRKKLEVTKNVHRHKNG